MYYLFDRVPKSGLKRKIKGNWYTNIINFLTLNFCPFLYSSFGLPITTVDPSTISMSQNDHFCKVTKKVMNEND